MRSWSFKWNKILFVIKVFFNFAILQVTKINWWKTNGTVNQNNLNLMLKIQFCHFSYHKGWCAAEMSTTDQKSPLWVDGGQPRYLITRNMKTQVNSMPPIMINLSWVARLSISLITVLDRPNMLATSSIFLCVPCVEPKQSHTCKQ